MLSMYSPTISDWYGKFVYERLVQAPKVQYIIANEMRKLAKKSPENIYITFLELIINEPYSNYPGHMII